MLHFILGRSGFGKTYRIFELIQTLQDDNEKILLVPEQYTFESERAMLNLPSWSRATVLSFSRLCQQVLTEHGGVAGDSVSEEEKLFLMTRAIHQVADRLLIYRRQAKSVQFAGHMVAMVQECTYGGITPDGLLKASLGLPTGALRSKVEEIALIFAAYEGLLKNSYHDPDEDLNRLYDLLEGTDFWQNKVVFIDGFKDFTAPRKKLLGQMIAHAKEVYITLTADGPDPKHNLELFANTKDLIKQLDRLARKAGMSVAPAEILRENHRGENEGMVALERVLAGEEVPWSQTGDTITICTCQDKYDEAEFVASTICRLVREEGYRYRDITVLAKDMSAYEGVLDVAFERYDIPYFSDRRQPVVHQPLAALMLKSVELAVKGFDSAVLLSYLKTRLAGLNFEEISTLENYVFVWNVKGKDWLSPFVHHPDGITDKIPPAEIMEELNGLRQAVVEPLQILKKDLSATHTIKGYAAAVYTFLEKNQVHRRLCTLAEELTDGGNAFEAEDAMRSFQVLVTLLDRMVAALGDTPLTPEDFYELLQLGIQSSDMGKIPQGIDQVVIGSADRTEGRPKGVFVLGANQGVFPGVPASGGLLTDWERRELNQVEIPLSDRCEFDTVEENFLFYTAATSATRQAFFTHLVSDGGQALSLCMPLLQVKDKLSGVKVLSAGQWQQAFPFAKAAGVNPAFDLLSHRYRDGSVLTGSLYRYFSEENPDLLNMLHRLTTTVDCSLEQENAKTLFGENVCVSPSGVEVYHKCRFYYFCRYGLRINPRQKVALDVLSRGTLVHYVLEQMFLSHGSRGLSTLSSEMLKSNIHSLLMDYVETTMGGLKEKTHTFLYQLERIETLLVSLLHHMAQELKDSGFETAACELKIGFDGQVSPLTVALPDGGTLSVMGVVDRLDVYEKDGITYFRVVDYKTGTKDFRLDDIYYGIGLQMLLYMYAVEKNGTAFGQHRQSAGVLYMPARRVSVRKEGDTEKQLAKTLQMKGLVLDDPAVIEAMDPHRSGLYMPFSFKKDGTLGTSKSLASLEFFGKTRKEIERLLYEMGKSLAIGEITCDPLDPSGTGEDACGYCDYKAVCPNNGDKPHRKIPTLSAAMEKELLKGGDFHELQAHAQTGTGD